MTELSFKAKDFEGPLDLLLALAIKNKMSLFDIDLQSLIDQYLEVVEHMQQHRLEVASEFIEMASRLVLLKSVRLLPRSDEAEKLSRELTGQLIEYALCKQVAQKLGYMSEGRFYAVREPLRPTWDNTYTVKHDISVLLVALNSAYGRKKLKRIPTQEQFEPLVARPVVSVSAKIIYLANILTIGKSVKLQKIFSAGDSVSGHIATFLAVLELLHDGSVSISQSGEITQNREIKHRQEGEASGFEAI